jgi:hypothetical protein
MIIILIKKFTNRVVKNLLYYIFGNSTSDCTKLSNFFNRLFDDSNLIHYNIEHRFDWKYLTVSNNLSCYCPYICMYISLLYILDKELGRK